MISNLGKVSYDNKVGGNKRRNMPPASNVGKIKAQNSPITTKQTTVSGDNQADAGVKTEEKRQKKVIRKNALYSDRAIAVAKKARGI